MERARRLAKNLTFFGLRRLRSGIAQMSVCGALDFGIHNPTIAPSQSPADVLTKKG
jgi:hypothetical protein